MALGVMLMGTLGANRFHYRLGVLDGAGRGAPNDNPNVMVALMDRLNVLGQAAPGWGRSDLERSSQPNLGLGFGFTHGSERTAVGDGTDATFDQSVRQAYAALSLRSARARATGGRRGPHGPGPGPGLVLSRPLPPAPAGSASRIRDAFPARWPAEVPKVAAVAYARRPWGC